MYVKNIDGETLRDLYVNKKLSYKSISKILNVHKDTVIRHAKSIGIKTRDKNEIKQLVSDKLKNRVFSDSHRKLISLNNCGRRKKGKTYEEIYGALKATQLKNLYSTQRTGTTRSKETKEAMGQIRHAAWKNGMYEHSIDKIRDKMIARLQTGVYNLKPNNVEKKVIAYIEQNNLPFKFVGNGKFWIENVNPDFVNVNGEKKAVEVNGCYWHNCPIHFPVKGYRSSIDRDEHKENVYKKYGWTVTTLWEHDIKQGAINI